MTERASPRRREDDDFREFVAVRMPRWRGSAYLLCRDWHTADDLVGETVAKIYRHWRRVRKADNPDAYAARMLTNAWLDESRRGWRRKERAVAEPAEVVEPNSARAGAKSFVPGYGSDIADREAVWSLLDSLGPRQRAVVVLRFYLDASVEETADLLGISEGTVKSQSARALASLRAVATAMRTEDAV